MVARRVPTGSREIANGLHWVRVEIERSLTRVRGFLEQYLESGTADDRRPLLDAAEELDQVSGTARMVQCYGAATLTHEMLQLLQTLIVGSGDGSETAYDALSGATLQLSDYVDLLALGEPDRVIVLQPAINELRLARGRPLCTEAALFAAQMQAAGIDLEPPATATGGAQALAGERLGAFQAQFLQWFRARDGGGALQAMNGIAERLSAAATTPVLRQLWWSVALLTESLDGDAEAPLELKRLLGRVGMQLRQLAERGEADAAASTGDSVGQLMYYVVRSSTPSVRARATVAACGLQQLLPDDVTLAQVRRRLRLPNTSVLERVHLEVRRDLQQVKDAIDLVVRTHGRAGADLDVQRQRLLRLAGTLGMLGLDGPQQVLINQSRALAGLDATSPGWIDTATALLRVEHSLEEALFRAQGRYHLTDPRPYGEIEAEVPHARDLREAVAALLREMLVNLSQVKSAVAIHLDGGGDTALGEVGRLLGEVAAGLQVIDRTGAADAVRRIAAYARDGGLSRVVDDPSAADRLADVIACLELYLEALRDGLPQPDALLARLDDCILRLQPVADDARDGAEKPVPPAAATAASAVAGPQLVDPEIRGIFIEEAAELLRQLEQDLPRLRRSPQDREVLTSVRRTFHTLKGSGRMVNAGRIAALAWAVEQVLNRCLDGALPVRPAVVDLAADATAQLPGLVATLRDDVDEPEGIDALLERAEQLRLGESAGGTDMYGVFREDARERLALVSGWLRSQPGSAGGDTAEVDVEPEVVRAFHTLRGSAGVIGATPVQRIAHAFEDYLNAVRLAGERLPGAALEQMSEAVNSLGGWIGVAAVADVPEEEIDSRVQSLRALQARLVLPAAAATSAEQEEITDRDAFTLDALDLLQMVEAELLAWREQAGHDSEDSSHGAAIGARLEELAGDAAAIGCDPLSEVANALAERLGAVTRAPSPALQSALEDVFEGLYQQLDAFRDGEPVAEASPLLDQVAGLPVSMPHRAAVETPTTDVGQPAPPLDPPAEAVTPSDLSESGELPEAELIPETDAPPPESADATASGSPAGIADPELLEIFLAEARELMADYREALQQAEEAPDAPEPVSAIRRTLHTLKGSSRMAGLENVGSACQDLERLAAGAEDDPLHDADVLPRLQQAELTLRQLLIDAGAVLDDMPVEAPQPTEPPQQDVASEPPIEPSAPIVAVDSPDAELTAVFSAEAGELLELLDGAFDAWRGGDEDEAVQDLRRALHTLKGGARVAGLDRMGDVVHELETQVERLLSAGGPVDEDTLQPLRHDIDQLHLMHDALRRGDRRALQAAPEVSLAPSGASMWTPELFWQPDDEQVQDSALRREYARVPVDALNGMLNQSGEVSIYRSRLEQHNLGLRAQLTEMTQTISRLRGQLRMMDIETEAQIAARGLTADAGQRDPDRYAQDFDPLEMDRYSRMQELSRALAEAVNDLSSLYGLLDQGVNETDQLLQQQGRISTQVQQGLMSTLMVPFSRQQSRLERVVRQTSLEMGKRVDLQFDGVATELDRNVLERVTAPLEHLLRNAVVHGIESAEQRRAAGKPDSGRIEVRLRREAEQLLIELADDGRGLDFAAIRDKAVERGRLRADAELSEDDLARFIFEPGFSTAPELTQDAGRGIGLDVVASTVRQLGGALELRSLPDQGTRFLVRLPLTLAVSQALLVVIGGESYAVPLPAIIGIARIPVSELPSRFKADAEPLMYAGQDYPVSYLGDYLDLTLPAEIESRSVVALLVRAGETLTGEERRVALVVDELLGNRELISKAIGPQLSAVPGVAGASILADGRVVLILDIPALIAERSRRSRLASTAPQPAVARDTIMVVDDSITMRRVAERLLERAGYRVVTARDGLDAIALLQTESPVTVLLDIEMPRADGFEVAAFIRNTERLARLPIIMITSRSGEKHRDRARSLGVDRYLIKPYQEDQLLQEVQAVIRG